LLFPIFVLVATYFDRGDYLNSEGPNSQQSYPLIWWTILTVF